MRSRQQATTTHRQAQIFQSSSLLLQAASPSAGGCAAGSGRRSGPSAPLPHGPLRDPLGPGTSENDSAEIRTTTRSGQNYHPCNLPHSGTYLQSLEGCL
jgi:hypothetical protein